VCGDGKKLGVRCVSELLEVTIIRK
jgi:hypothetical protein